MKTAPTQAANHVGEVSSELAVDTPTMRLFALLEVIAAKDQRDPWQALVEETGPPSPTLHRMLQQLEVAGRLQREGDGRQHGTGTRRRRLAENLLMNDSHHGAHHMVLRRLGSNSFAAKRCRPPRYPACDTTCAMSSRPGRSPSTTPA